MNTSAYTVPESMGFLSADIPVGSVFASSGKDEAMLQAIMSPGANFATIASEAAAGSIPGVVTGGQSPGHLLGALSLSKLQLEDICAHAAKMKCEKEHEEIAEAKEKAGKGHKIAGKAKISERHAAEQAEIANRMLSERAHAQNDPGKGGVEAEAVGGGLLSGIVADMAAGGADLFHGMGGMAKAVNSNIPQLEGGGEYLSPEALGTFGYSSPSPQLMAMMRAQQPAGMGMSRAA